MALVKQVALLKELPKVDILIIDVAKTAIPGQQYRTIDTNEIAYGNEDGSLRWTATQDLLEQFVDFSTDETIASIKTFAPTTGNNIMKFGLSDWFTFGYKSGYGSMNWFADYDANGDLISRHPSVRAKQFVPVANGFKFNIYENAGNDLAVGTETVLLDVLETGFAYKDLLVADVNDFRYDGDRVEVKPSQKMWEIFGDSMSNSISNDYPKYVKDKVGFVGANLTVHAVTGNKMVQQEQVLTDLLAATPTYFDDKEIVSLLIGANDFSQDYALGSRNSTVGEDSVAGKMKSWIEKLLTANPNLELYIFTPLKANNENVFYNAPNAAGWYLKDMAAMVQQICYDYSIQCVDLYGMAQFNEQTIPTYTSDGLHPNAAGAEVIGEIIADAFQIRNNTGHNNLLPASLGTVGQNLQVVDDGNGNLSLEYVDASATGIASAENGLTITGDIVRLGGALTGNTVVTATGQTLDFVANDLSLNFSDSAIEMRGVAGIFSMSDTALTFQDDRTGAAAVGIQYTSDISANFTDNSLITKKFVDDLLEAQVYQNGINKSEATGEIELGGDLLHATTIGLSTFDLNFTTGGGSIVSAADMRITDATKGLVLTAASGSQYRVGVTEGSAGSAFLTVDAIS